MHKSEVMDTAASLCGILTDLGCIYEFEADNRSQNKSVYIYVRRPRYFQVRVSDHPRKKHARKMMIDIGPHGLSLDEAIVQIKAKLA